MVHCLMPAAAWDYFLQCEHAPLLSQAMVCDRQARTHPPMVTHKTLFLNLIINQVLLLFLRQTLDLKLFDLIWTKPVFRKDASWPQGKMQAGFKTENVEIFHLQAVLAIGTASQVLLFWFWFKVVLLRAQPCWFNFTKEEHKKCPPPPPSHIKFARHWPLSCHRPGQYGNTQKYAFAHFKHQILTHQKSIHQEKTAVG